MDLTTYEKYLAKHKAQQVILKANADQIAEDLGLVRTRKDDQEEAREIMSVVGILSQTKTKQVIEELVTDVLQGVFGPDYKFIIEDVVARNKPEMNFYVEKGGKKRDLKHEKGGSVCVLVAFALRVILCAIAARKIRPTIILDEPLKDSSKDKLDFLATMVKQVSSLLKIQFIIITHEEELIAAADAAFRVSQTKLDYAIVEQIV